MRWAPPLLLLLLVCFIPTQNPIIYVKTVGADAGDGMSWDTAFTDPQEAFLQADMTNGPDTVVIAEGVYPAGHTWAHPELMSFTVFDDTTVIGGYAVGDHWEDPTGGTTELTGYLIESGNTHNVVTINSGCGRVSLKSLKISGGHGGLPGYSPFIDPETRSGGGIFFCNQYVRYPVQIALEDIWIDDCFAYRSGGGMYFHAVSSFGDLELNILRLKITGCSAGVFGGGAHVYLEEADPDTEIESMVQSLSISKCQSGAVTGGLSWEARACQVEITNSEIYDNIAVSSGGFSMQASSSPAPATITARFCTFYNNEANTLPSGFAAASAHAHILFESCVFWGNGAGLYVGGGVTLNYCCIPQNAAAGTENIYMDPQLDTHRTPMAGSPLVDAGKVSEHPNDFFDLDGDLDFLERVPFDLNGRHRYAPFLSDIGAHERQ